MDKLLRRKEDRPGLIRRRGAGAEGAGARGARRRARCGAYARGVWRICSHGFTQDGAPE